MKVLSHSYAVTMYNSACILHVAGIYYTTVAIHLCIEFMMQLYSTNVTMVLRTCSCMQKYVYCLRSSDIGPLILTKIIIQCFNYEANSGGLVHNITCWLSYN